MKRFVLLVTTLLGGWALYEHNAARPREATVIEQPRTRARPAPVAMPLSEPSPAFACDGRTRCPQMTSCAEARYFLQHCPGVEMDGDRDGEPCEDQWCS